MDNFESSSKLDIREIFAILYRRKWWLIIPTIIVTCIAYAGSYFLTPQYESETIIWIDKPDNVSRELSNLIGERRMSREELYSQQLALQTELTSQNYLSQLIREMNLGEDLEHIRQATKAREDHPDLSLDQVKEILLVDALRERISVTFLGSDQFKIKVVSSNPGECRDMANNLASILEREKAKYEMEKILDNQDFTDLQLERSEFEYKQTVDSLNASRARLNQFQLPENITDESNRLEILSSIDKVSLDISDFEKQLTDIESELRNYNLVVERIKYSDTVIELKTNINLLLTNYSRMMEKYSWTDQNIINVNIRLADNTQLLENMVEGEVLKKYASYPKNQQDLIARYYVSKENIDILETKKNRLEASMKKIDDRINLIPRLESEVNELANQVESARKYRDAFKSEETTVGILSERAKERTKYKVIEPAQLPLEPFWPSKKKLLVMGVILGLIIGGAVTLILEILDNSFKKVEDIEEELGLPVLAAIPKIDKLNAGI